MESSTQHSPPVLLLIPFALWAGGATEDKAASKNGEFVCLYAICDFCKKIAKSLWDKKVSITVELVRIGGTVLLAVSTTNASSSAFSVERTSTNSTCQVLLGCMHCGERVHN